MGFFERIFGRQEEKILTLGISGLEAFLERETLSQKQELSGIIAARFSEIKHLLRSLVASVKQLEGKDFSSENNRLSGIVRTSRQNAIKQLSSLAQKLDPPAAVEMKTAFSYCNDSLVLLQRESYVFGKNIAYTSIYLKDEVKEIGNRVKEIADTLNELKKEIGHYRHLLAVEKILGEKKELLLQKEAGAEARQSASSLKATIFSLEKQASALNESLTAMQKSDEFARLAALQQERDSLAKKKQGLRAEALGFFAAVDKPLKRFGSLLKAKRLFLKNPEQEAVFFALLNDPFVALKKDPGGEAVKEILAEVKKAIEGNAISLKEKERQKRVDALNQLLATNFFDSFFWKLNEIEVSLGNAEKKLLQEQLFKKISEEKNLLGAVGKQLEQARIDLLQKESEAAKKHETAAILKQRLENSLQEMLNKKVSISVE